MTFSKIHCANWFDGQKTPVAWLACRHVSTICSVRASAFSVNPLVAAASLKALPSETNCRAPARLASWNSGCGQRAVGRVNPPMILLDVAPLSADSTVSKWRATSVSVRPAMITQSGSRFRLSFFFISSMAE